MIAIMLKLNDLLLALPAISRSCETGALLFRQDDEVVVVHLVRSGSVHLVRHQPGGTTLILQRASAGSVLAEASVFSSRYHCDAVATAPTSTSAVKASEIRRLLQDSQEFTAAWLRHLAAEVQSARTRAEVLSLRTVAERLKAWLLPRSGVLPPKGQWKSIAAEIGVSPEALYREIARRRPVSEAPHRRGR